MAHTTSRLGLDVVDGGDNVSAYPAANAQAMGVLDNAAVFISGTLVSRPAASIQGRYYLATDDTSSGSSIGTLYFDTGAAWVSGFNPPSRGAVNVSTSQSTSSATYTTLATPDQVTGVVLPTNGLIAVQYQATWQESVQGAARAAILVNSNQLKVQSFTLSGGINAGPNTQAACTNQSDPAVVNHNSPIVSCPVGLVSSASPTTQFTSDATTGQAVGVLSSGAAFAMEVGGQVIKFANATGTNDFAVGWGGWCLIDNLPAGTYTVSIQFKASSGSVTVSNRRLRVRAETFS